VTRRDVGLGRASTLRHATGTPPSAGRRTLPCERGVSSRAYLRDDQRLATSTATLSVSVDAAWCGREPKRVADSDGQDEDGATDETIRTNRRGTTGTTNRVAPHGSLVLSRARANLCGTSCLCPAVSGASSVRGGCSTKASHESRPPTLTRPAAHARAISAISPRPLGRGAITQEQSE